MLPGRLSSDPRAFTLIEVMMAMTILLVGFVGLVQAVTIGSESLDTARKLQVANQLVAAEIEKLRGGDWSTVANLPATATLAIDASGAVTGDTTQFALANRTADASDDDSVLCAAAKGFTCSLTRTYLRPAAASAATVTYLQVNYSVRWTGNTGRIHRHRVDAFFAKNGLHLSFQQS